ncbi:Planctomycete cytochrome C [Rubripirellula tenax]|uniref:Planctomycete cytochrome C n=1 Tax=Rubripirellula tenax TaxID=2528015 RepID=A0A5C6FDU9_9BACT|nr:PSD1 and planctomycete cytochrome C domain-containing protein [Rubripirellula tenax]TWU58867.1 Planctomycete cytochrome C [Rubripirellula tenax]
MRYIYRLSIIALATLVALTPKARGDDAGIRFFERKVRPILVKHCYECHSHETGESNGDLLVDSRDGLLNGGELGPAIKPGDAEGSLLFDAVTYQNEDLLMPPDKRLSDTEIAAMRKWIEMGAPDPRRGKVKEDDAPIDFEKAREHWAFRPIANQEPPQVFDAQWPQSPIDNFILARLEKEKMKPVELADSATIMRRVYYDLTGLPPTPEQQDQFLLAAKRDSPKAYEQLVEDLLKSPRFGERWGRHWLDVVHYAETFSKPRNFVNPLIWKYRDYVIDAYNNDKPFDQFLTEQIAGDLLPAEKLSQRREQMVATGMLLTGQRAYTGNGNSAESQEYHADDIDDQLNVIGHAFLGLSIACARCHDHKFDPIPTRDYYALAGTLRSTSSYNSHVVPPFHEENQGGPSAGVSARYVAMPNEAKKLEQISTSFTKAEGMRSTIRRLTVRLEKLKANNSSPDEIKATDKKLAGLKVTLEKLESKLAEPITAEMVAAVADHPKPVEQPVFIKGDSANPGPVVPRGFLQIIPVSTDTIPIPEDQSGRLQLARWLTSSDNPLVARVYVNRIWQHLFGIGLVESADNFGLMSQPPSHPALLNYLARQFRDGGMSTKSLIRTLVLSRTYRLSSSPVESAMKRDPDAKLRWRMTPRRLEAEAIRDTVMLASQQLVSGSPGPSEAARLGFHQVGRATVSYDIPHRSVYLSILREAVPQQLELFDFPDPSFVRGRRSTANMPTQALYMMNSEFIAKASRLAAKHMIKVDHPESARIDLAVRTILSRPAREDENRQLARYLDDAIRAGVGTEEAWSQLCQILFASTEFRYVW